MLVAHDQARGVEQAFPDHPLEEHLVSRRVARAIEKKNKSRFRANGQCPAPIQVNESVRSLGKSVDFDLTIEWTQICNVAEDTSPLVLLISTITGLLILVGGGRSSEP